MDRGRVIAFPQLDDLHHRYERAASITRFEMRLTLNDAVFRGARSRMRQERWHSPRPRRFWTAVSSVGDFLICVRDGARVTVYSLSSGEIQARLYGW